MYSFCRYSQGFHGNGASEDIRWFFSPFGNYVSWTFRNKVSNYFNVLLVDSLMLFVKWQERHPACKNLCSVHFAFHWSNLEWTRSVWNDPGHCGVTQVNLEWPMSTGLRQKKAVFYVDGKNSEWSCLKGLDTWCFQYLQVMHRKLLKRVCVCN